MSTIERIDFYRAAFSGQVLEIKKSGELEEVRFKVAKSWKYVHGNEAVVTKVLGLSFVYFRKSPGSSFAISRDSASQR